MSGISAPFESFTALNQEQNNIKTDLITKTGFNYVQIYSFVFFSSITVARNPEKKNRERTAIKGR